MTCIQDLDLRVLELKIRERLRPEDFMFSVSRIGPFLLVAIIERFEFVENRDFFANPLKSFRGTYNGSYRDESELADRIEFELLFGDRPYGDYSQF
jgi:hypothetical protein